MINFHKIEITLCNLYILIYKSIQFEANVEFLSDIKPPVWRK